MAERQRQDNPGGSPTRGSGGSDPSVAVLLTWFLPGSGHLYLGRGLQAAIAFALVEGLYLLGWFLCDGRSFEVLDPELRGAMATLLTPEVGNLGAMVLQLQRVGFGGEVPSPYPPHMALGGILCGLSGFANVLLMAHAHLLARTPDGAPRQGRHPVALLGAAWFIPGLGHILQGRRKRGIMVFAMLVGLLVWGTWMADFSNLSRERHFYYWSGQFLAGLPALGAEILSGRPPVTGEIPLADVGLLFACMAGLLNVLAMLDVFGVAEARWLGVQAPNDQQADGVQNPAHRTMTGGSGEAQPGEIQP